MARKAHRRQSKARIYLVDDEPTVRQGMRMLFAQQQNLIVCGESDHPAEALNDVLALDPDLVVIDVAFARKKGLHLIRDLRRLRPPVKILVFSLHNELYFVRNSLAAGADGYVAKEEGTECLLLAAQTVLSGHHYLGAAFVSQMPEIRNWLRSRA